MDYITYEEKINMMNKLKKGDIVIHKNLEGRRFIVEYFDYSGLLIGLRRFYDNNSKESRILWTDPELVIPCAANTVYNSINSSRMEIKNVIFNDPATIVFWSDGSKTVVKSHLDDYDPEKGLAMAIAKKALGNEGNYYNVFKKWLPKEDSTIDTVGTRVNELFKKMLNKRLEDLRKSIENN